MTTAEKIYIAKEKWDCSFEQIAFLLELDRKAVIQFYRQEKVKHLPKITIDSSTDCLNLTTRTKNILKRAKIYTIRDLITYTGEFYAIRGCGEQSLDEIADAFQSIQSVLKLKPASLIAIIIGKGSGNVSVELNFVDSNPNYGKVMTKWKITNEHIERISTEKCNAKGFARTVFIDVWLN